MSTTDWQTFSKKSTFHLHAIQDIDSAASSKWKVFWIVILIACTCAASVEIYRVFDQYNKNPILTTYDYRALTNSSFPQVTVCLPHFINSSKVAEEKIAPSVVNQMIGATWAPLYMSMLMTGINDKFETPVGELTPLLISSNESQAFAMAQQLAPFFQAEPEALVEASANELSELFPNITLRNDLFKAHYKQISKYLTIEGHIDNQKFLDVFGLQLNGCLWSTT